MNQTEQQILAEIDAKGYTTIEHGRGFGRKTSYGTRRVNARNSLISKHIIRITHSGKETDALRGYTSFHYWSRVVRENRLEYACGCSYPTTEPSRSYDHNCAACHKALTGGKAW